MKWYATIGLHDFESRDQVANKKYYITTFTKVTIVTFGWNTYDSKIIPLLYVMRFVIFQLLYSYMSFIAHFP